MFVVSVLSQINPVTLSDPMFLIAFIDFHVYQDLPNGPFSFV
jgi:hypothetical protein